MDGIYSTAFSSFFKNELGRPFLVDLLINDFFQSSKSAPPSFAMEGEIERRNIHIVRILFTLNNIAGKNWIFHCGTIFLPTVKDRNSDQSLVI